MSLVFDSSAMLALLRDEPGADFVQNLIDDADVPKYAHAVNFVEVFYDFLKQSREIAENAIADLKSLGIEERSDLDGAFWRDVATIVCDARKDGGHLALGDAFGIALSRRLDADFVTADRHEIEALANANICRAVFIR